MLTRGYGDFTTPLVVIRDIGKYLQLTGISIFFMGIFGIVSEAIWR